MSFRVKEINPAYDFVPFGPSIWVPDENDILHEQPTDIPGPGWIFCSNEIETEDEAQQYALTHTKRTGFKTEIVNLQKLLCSPMIKK